MNTEWLTELGRNFETLRRRTDSYNIFQVLEIESKEVLICRFLGDLLDPNGSHGCEIEFLKRFFKLLKAEEVSDAELMNAKVVLEEHTDNNRRIDIVIHLSTEVYPIEVKIWAEDQDGQLYDYLEYFNCIFNYIRKSHRVCQRILLSAYHFRMTSDHGWKFV